MKNDARDRFTEELRTFCGHAARQMLGLEVRLRTLVAATERPPELQLLEEAVGSSLRITKILLDAGQQGRHATLLALRPLLRALSAARR